MMLIKELFKSISFLYEVNVQGYFHSRRDTELTQASDAGPLPASCLIMFLFYIRYQLSKHQQPDKNCLFWARRRIKEKYSFH